jgi:hypothetical protein
MLASTERVRMNRGEFEAGSVGESLLIDLDTVVAIQRRRDDYTIYTIAGPINVSREVAERVRAAWKKPPRE